MAVKVKAVHEADLEKYLESIGILNDILEGKISCRHCKDVITLENFLCMYPFDYELAISCNKPICYVRALQEAQEVLR